MPSPESPHGEKQREGSGRSGLTDSSSGRDGQEPRLPTGDVQREGLLTARSLHSWGGQAGSRVCGGREVGPGVARWRACCSAPSQGSVLWGCHCHPITLLPVTGNGAASALGTSHAGK